MRSFKISVIIPAKNRKKELEKALNSVSKQTLQPIEIIVVDDGSIDGTYAMLSSKYPTVTVIKNSHSVGGAIARNQGVEQAKGDYIAFLDSDDEWKSFHLEKMIDFLEESNYWGGFSSFLISYDEGKTVVAPDFNTKKKDENVVSYIIGSGKGGDIRTSTLVLCRDKFQELRFDEDLKKYQDWDLAIRFNEKFGLHSIDSRSAILNVAAQDRMSAKMDLEATRYFMNKHDSYISDLDKLNFYLNLTYKAALVTDRSSAEFKYSVSCAKHYVHKIGSLSHKIKLAGLTFPLVNIPRIYFKIKQNLILNL